MSVPTQPTTARASSPRRRLLHDWRATFRVLGVSLLAPPPSIRLVSGARLRPDFFVLSSRQFLFVTPSIELPAINVLARLAARSLTSVPPRESAGDEACPDIPIIGLAEHGVMLGWERGLSPDDPRTVALCQCRDCKLWYFADDAASWRCTASGCVYRGNNDLLENLSSPLAHFPLLAPLQHMG